MQRTVERRSDQDEREALVGQLHELESALQELIHYPEMLANQAVVAQVYRYGRQLAKMVPRYFQKEEKSVLEPVADQGPEGAAFVREMRRQHARLGQKLSELAAAMDELEDAEDQEQCIGEVRRRGQEFARQLASHMGAEERGLELLGKAPR